MTMLNDDDIYIEMSCGQIIKDSHDLSARGREEGDVHYADSLRREGFESFGELPSIH